MPQLNPDSFASQIFWLVVTFSVLYVATARSVIPRIRDVLEKRQHQVMDNLDAADAAKQQAEDARQTYEAELEDAKEKAHTLLNTTRSEVSAMMADELQTLNGKLDAQLSKAEAQLADQRKDVMNEIEPMLQELTGMIVKHIGHVDADEKRITKAVKARME
jgi:F-type H+-transporting ATPase subunit b